MDLSLVSIDDMVDELKSRTDGFILATHKEVVEGSEDVSLWYHGGRMKGIGLCEKLKQDLLDVKEFEIDEA